jgi:regulator of sigma D
MPAQTVNAQESSTSDSSQTHDIARRELRRSRSVILSYLLKLNKSINANHSDLVQAIAQRFNDVLVDYISYGHFRLLQGCTVETHQMVAIDKTTQQALRFSDKYTTRDEIALGNMKQDLEALAYALEVRFEVEDEVLTTAA